MSAPTGIEGPLVTPGSPEWLQSMSASKIAAVLGLSPFESRFGLWFRMAGILDNEDDSDQLRRGHYLEPAIAHWFSDQHPDWKIATTGTWTAAGRPWQTASPDRLIVKPGGSTALLECKSALQEFEWGDPLTDQIPPYYRAQVMWQADTIGVSTVHVAVITAHLEFAEYEVAYDPIEAGELRAAAAEFLTSIRQGEQPSIDEHVATYQAIRELHPMIDGGDVELDESLVRLYCQARADLAAATDSERYARSLIADAMGNAKRARFDGKTIASREVRGDAPPFVKAGRNLPSFTNPETEGVAA